MNHLCYTKKNHGFGILAVTWWLKLNPFKNILHLYLSAMETTLTLQRHPPTCTNTCYILHTVSTQIFIINFFEKILAVATLMLKYIERQITGCMDF